MAENQPAGGSIRTAVRWGLLLAGLVTAAMRAPELHRFWVQWQSLAGVDPSAAQAYRTYFLVESGITAFVVALGFAFFYLLRPAPKKVE